MAEKPHIVVFPFFAQGHLIPFLALARLIEQKTPCTITVVSTPLNIQALQPSLPPTSAICFSSLPFNGTAHGLPPITENTDSIPISLFYSFFKAADALQPSFEKLVSDICQQDGRPPFCIISDMFFGWTVEIANRLGIFHTTFIASGAYGTALLFSFWLHLPHLKNQSDGFLLEDFLDAGLIHRSQVPAHVLKADGTDWSSLYHRRVISGCLSSDGLLFNTVEGLEKTGLAYFSRKTGRPVWAIGPVARVPNRHQQERMENGICRNPCISWLDMQHPRSVLYICFGSQSSIGFSQMMELAIGLESSGHKFIWVVRPPSGFDVNEDIRPEWLPEGFEDRVMERKQGILVRTWAPQQEILGHESTAAFLSHCGWNSAMESLQNGVSMIGWPLDGEQCFNSKLLEEQVGVCVEIARGKGGEVRRGRVEEVIGMVMGETGKGREMRKTACRVKEMMKEAIKEEGEFRGSSMRAMEDFISACSRRYSPSRENEREVS